MNKGNFEKNCQILLTHIYSLSEKGKFKFCNATTKYLSNIIGKSERQTYKYLKSLKERMLITVDTTKLRRDFTTSKLYKKRKIATTLSRPPDKFYNIRQIYFTKQFSLEEKRKYIYNLVDHQMAYVDKQVRELGSEWRTIISNYTPQEEIYTVPEGFEDLFLTKPDEDMVAEKEKYRKIYEEEVKREAKERKYTEFKVKMEKKSEELLKNRYDHDIKLEGETAFDKLLDFNIKFHKKWESTDKESLEALAENTVFEENDYFTTIYLGGEIPVKLNLWKYVNWDRNSEVFKQFKEMVK